MNYYLCPRCKFRVAANKLLCATCGYKLVVTGDAKSGGKESAKASAKSSMLGWFVNNLEKSQEKKADSTQEKPALS